MMPATATSRPVCTWPTNRLMALSLANWQTYWPLWLGTLGLLWLGTSLLTAPLNDWMAMYTAVLKTYGRDLKASAYDEFMKGFTAAATGGPAPDGTNYLLLWKLSWSLFIPCGLVLSGTGHYLYRYVLRQTLFSSGTTPKVVFALVIVITGIVWAHLASTGTVRFSAQSYAFGFDTALPTAVFGYWMAQGLITHFVVRRREQRELAQAAYRAELAALTAQVNPPFIFHALQHLQATAQTEGLPRTGQSLTQLAGIMQYVLEESRKQLTDVSREIDFIRDYLRLQELRLLQRDTIQICTTVEWDGKPTPIVPLLLNPLIENAFKYGISIQQACFVAILERHQILMSDKRSVPLSPAYRDDLLIRLK